MTVGKTHSGKTTFGKKLAQKIKNNILIDNDQIAEFLKENYENLYSPDFLKDSIKWSSGAYLKQSLVKTIFRFALKTNLFIISTGANSTKRLRKSLVTLARKNNRKVIIISFNLSEKVLLSRINKSKRSKKCLCHSKDFRDLLLNKQSIKFESANKSESDYYFEINKVANVNEVLDKVLKIVKRKTN